MRNQRGITGLETAIVLIAFVAVASVFAYTVLAAGIFSPAEERGYVESTVRVEVNYEPEPFAVQMESLVGQSVREARQMLSSSFVILPNAEAVVNGKTVGEDRILQAGDRLKFKEP